MTSPQRRGDAEISGEKTEAIGRMVFSALNSASLRLCGEWIVPITPERSFRSRRSRRYSRSVPWDHLSTVRGAAAGRPSLCRRWRRESQAPLHASRNRNRHQLPYDMATSLFSSPQTETCRPCLCFRVGFGSRAMVGGATEARAFVVSGTRTFRS